MSLFTRAQKVWNTLFKSNHSPQALKETEHLLKLILAKTYLNIRSEACTASNKSHELSSRRVVNDSNDRLVSSPRIITDIFPRKTLENLFEEAIKKLEKEQIYSWNNRALQTEMNRLLEPEVMSLLQTFSIVDQDIKLVRGTEDEWDSYSQKILLEEANDIKRKIEKSNEAEPEYNQSSHKISDSISNQLAFLTKKYAAIQKLASSEEWEEIPERLLPTSVEVDREEGSISADAFGYVENESRGINKAIREHQRKNLIRAFHLRSQLGYSTIALQSTIDGAGRGIYVDGFCPAGSLLAFFPGYVWPKEHLLKADAIEHVFKDDPLHHLSMRYDDTLIDSRKAPYTVLDGDNSNPLAIGHIANHPPKGITPNCSTTMVNFFEPVGETLQKYIPNIYARDPMLLGPSLFNQRKVFMQGFALLAMRDLKNEECFYDYKLSQDRNMRRPDWYHIPKNK